jgi:hypothetical protein
MNAHPDTVAIDASSGEVGALQALLEALSEEQNARLLTEP